MKNKNTVVALLLVFCAICAYNIYYSYVRISKDADLANKTPEQRSEWLKDAGEVEAYKTAVSNSMSLGLDLQGGMFITMEIGVADVVNGLAEYPTDATFATALRNARMRSKTSQSEFVDIFVTALREQDPKVKLATYFANTSTRLNLNANDDEVIRTLKKEANDAIERTFNIIRTRIDQFGVASPNLQRQPGTGRILIELPGVKDASRVRKLLRGTAKLEFWPTYTYAEAVPVLERIDERVRQITGVTDSTGKAVKKADTKTEEMKDTTKKSLQEALGQKTAEASTPADSAKKDSADAKAVRKQFDTEHPFFAGMSFPNFQQMGPSSPVCVFALPTDTARINSYLRMPQVQPLIPADMRFLWTAKPDRNETQYLTLIAVKTNREGRAPLAGDVIIDTKQDYDQDGKSPTVTMNMNADGAKVWKKLTTDYLNKSIAVVLDNQVYTYPNVNNVIANGSSVISGNFTLEEAKDLANILKAGKLPAPAMIESDEVIGPSLGKDTTEKGLISFAFGFLSIMAFMMLYYRGSGVVASIALIINLFLVMGVSGAFNVVLTLPGIAGIVLSLAMAVDANVLIYERTREELEAGRSFKSAIAAGFKNAFSAIIDGNVTIMLTGIILYVFGSGPIRGFAVTLMIGIVTTLVAALIVTRLMLEYLANRSEKAPIAFGNKAAAEFFNRLKVEFIGNRRIWYVVSGALMALSIVAILGFGFKLGVDFKGGRQYVIELNQLPTLETIENVRQDLTVAFEGNQPLIKTLGTKNQLMVTTAYLYGIDVNVEGADEKVAAAMMAGLNKRHESLKPTIGRSTSIGPTLAEDIKTGAVYAVTLSLIGVFLYIFIRFRRWQYGAGAVVSLAFNVLMVLGVFALLGSIEGLGFSAEVDQTFIAALLTIVGYTINDTVVVYDRIRETTGTDMESSRLPGYFNRALNDTLSRTVVTSNTTIISALILFFFGGDVLKGFMLALVAGIVVGTYSSVFVASPISLDLMLSRTPKAEREKAQTPEPARA